MKVAKHLWLIVLLATFVFSCPSEPEPLDPDPPIIDENNEPVDNNPDQEPEIVPEDGNTEPETTPVDTEPEVFEVTEEQYQETFESIEDIIFTLNQVIRRRDFPQWLTYLDEVYVETMGSQERLSALNERPIIQQAGIVMSDLEDFFTFVVVPSRSNVKLDEIVFLDNNHVTAYMYIDDDPNQRIILYQLTFDEERWKITLW